MEGGGGHKSARYLSQNCGHASAHIRAADGDNLPLSECKFCVVVHIGGLDRRVVVVKGYHLLQMWRGGRRGREGGMHGGGRAWEEREGEDGKRRKREGEDGRRRKREGEDKKRGEGGKELTTRGMAHASHS